MMANKHGGARDGSGRRPVAEVTVAKTVLLTPEQWETAKEIGYGNMARGIRLALDVAKEVRLAQARRNDRLSEKNGKAVGDGDN